MSVELRQGDVFLTRGSGFFGWAIRLFTCAIGESRTKVNHVGLVVENRELESAVVVEALIRVKRHKLWSQYGPPGGDSVAIYRALNLSPDQITAIVSEAESHVGQHYGYCKIVAHFLDWLLLGAYVFRRIARNGNYPICSWLVAHSFSKAGKNFGVETGAATPDDIWDFIQDNPDIYAEIYPLSPLGKAREDS